MGLQSGKASGAQCVQDAFAAFAVYLQPTDLAVLLVWTVLLTSVLTVPSAVRIVDLLLEGPAAEFVAQIQLAAVDCSLSFVAYWHPFVLAGVMIMLVVVLKQMVGQEETHLLNFQTLAAESDSSGRAILFSLSDAELD